jgi:CBS domain-containing protein
MSLAPLIKTHQVISLPPTASILDAAKKMADHSVGSILVMEGNSLVGIFSERDLLNRVIAKGLEPKNIPLSQVMSRNVRTVDVGQSVESVFQKMEETKCRRIPITDGGKVIGVVTMRNILEWLTEQMKEENIYLKKYIQG